MILLSIYIVSAVITMCITSTVIFIYTKDFAEGLQYIGAALSAGIFCFVTIPFVIIVGGAWLISNKIKSNMKKIGNRKSEFVSTINLSRILKGEL